MNSVRAAARLMHESRPAAQRQFSTSSASLGGEYAWMHGKQFDFPAEKNRALKYGCGTAALVGMGAFIPFFAAWFQIQKAKG